MSGATSAHNHVRWFLQRGRLSREVWWQPQPALREEPGCIPVPSWEIPGKSAASAVSKTAAALPVPP